MHQSRSYMSLRTILMCSNTWNLPSLQLVISVSFAVTLTNTRYKQEASARRNCPFLWFLTSPISFCFFVYPSLTKRVWERQTCRNNTTDTPICLPLWVLFLCFSLCQIHRPCQTSREVSDLLCLWWLQVGEGEDEQKREAWERRGRREQGNDRRQKEKRKEGGEGGRSMGRKVKGFEKSKM